MLLIGKSDVAAHSHIAASLAERSLSSLHDSQVRVRSSALQALFVRITQTTVRHLQEIGGTFSLKGKGYAVRNLHAKSTNGFYHKDPETGHDEVSYPINPQVCELVHCHSHTSIAKILAGGTKP
jgi:hypothetical protein